MAKKYSDEQISRAASIDLEQYLSRRGERLKRVGGQYAWIYRDGSGEHDSVMIRGNKWYDHKRQQGGTPINFLQEFMGLTFRQSMEELLYGEQPEQEMGMKHEPRPTVPFPVAADPKKEFALPKANGNMHRVFAYLTKTRFLHPDVVTHFVKAKSLYEDERHNAVFLGLDENGVAHAGQKKGTLTFGESYRRTLAGSETEYGFAHKGSGSKLFVFEAPIDMLSYISINMDKWQEQSYVALDGLSSKAMLRFLENNLQVDEICICVDHDEAGIEATDKFKDELLEKGYAADKIMRLLPEMKDWNEIIKARLGHDAAPASSHPKIDDYERITDNLSKTYERMHERYGERFATLVLEQGQTGIANALAAEFSRYEKAVSEVEKADTAYPQKHLLNLANLSMMAALDGTAPENKIGRYKSAMLELFQDYKPYTDKAKLQARHTNLQKEFQQLCHALKSSAELPEASGALQHFADSCIRGAVYFDTQFQQDMALKQSLKEREPVMLHSESTLASAEQDEPAEEYEMVQSM